MKDIWIPTQEERDMLLSYAMGGLHLQFDDAQDLIQDAMIKYWNHFSNDFNITAEKPRQYFSLVMKNLFLNNERREKKEFNFSTVLFEMEKYIIEEEINIERVERTVENYLASLSGDVRIVIELYTEGKNKRQIVMETGISLNRVSNILKKDRDLGKILKQINIDHPL